MADRIKTRYKLACTGEFGGAPEVLTRWSVFAKRQPGWANGIRGVILAVGRLNFLFVPSVFRFGADLPRGPSGKVQRLKLLTLLEDAA